VCLLNVPAETFIVAEWLALLFFVRQVPNSKLERTTPKTEWLRQACLRSLIPTVRLIFGSE
jgi:hypothetical protein